MLANIWKLYAIRITKWFMLFMPIIVLFLQSNGLDLREVMLVNSCYAMTVAACEIPSGYFSDRLGRKNSMVIGCILITGQFLCYSIAYDFWLFAIGATIGGVGVSFISGTDAALLYDSLVAVNRQRDYIRWSGYSYAIGTFAEAIAAIIGGWVALHYSMRMTIYGQVGLSLLGVVIACSLQEPPVEKEDEGSHWDALIATLRYALIENKQLVFLLVITIVVGFASLTMAWFVQPYLEFQEMPKDKMGYWWALFNLVVAVSSAQAYRLQHHFSNRLLTTMIVIIILFGYIIWGFWGASWTVSLIIMLLMYIARGVAVPIFTDWINQQTSSSRRATVLSIKGFGIRMLFAIVAPLLGWWADIFSVLDAFLLMGGILGILITLSIAFYYVFLESKNS